MSTIKLM